MRVQSEFQIGDLLPIGMTIVVLGIALAYSLQVASDVKSDMTPGTSEYFAISSGTVVAVGGIAEKLPTIVTIVIAAVVIGILVTYLAKKFM